MFKNSSFIVVAWLKCALWAVTICCHVTHNDQVIAGETITRDVASAENVHNFCSRRETGLRYIQE